jgi:prepilin-type N-terminal cleavage/methylation domain-containing protein
MRPLNKRSPSCQGFTLIELALVLVIIGILSTFGMPKLLDSTSITLSAQADRMASDLRRVQWMATTGNLSLCVAVTSNQYSVHLFTTSCHLGSPISDPVTRTPFTVVLPTLSSLTDTVSPSPLYFNSLGQPSRQGAFRLASSDTSFTVMVNVTPVTGFVSNITAP